MTDPTPPWWLKPMNKMMMAAMKIGPNPDEFEALAGRCSVFRFDSV